jgi:hypothetical protein
MDYVSLINDALLLVSTEKDSAPEYIDMELVEEVAVYLASTALSRFVQETENLPDTEEGQEASERLLSEAIQHVVAAAYVLAKIDGTSDQPSNPLTNRIVEELLARGEVHLSIQVD